MIAFEIKVVGLVQGVGFRPFVYRMARKFNLSGNVRNLSDGVKILAQGEQKNVSLFLESLNNETPPAAQIHNISTKETEPQLITDFSIAESMDNTNAITEISPDIAVCPECLEDMRSQPHRINFPLINCTNCGPRFTIITDLPYDRRNTTMKPFRMCKDCSNEYNDILDRRFHAQPVACNICGPVYEMIYGDMIIQALNDIILTATNLLNEGKIIAVKGTGGFHLMCNAIDEKAVNRLRTSKMREGKPFAVMFKDIETVKEYAELNSLEEKSITSWRRPIVLLQTKKGLAPSVTLGLNTIGAFLPYMPVHYLLFDKLNLPALVLTSGNLAEEPIIINETKAEKVFKDTADAILYYNREIQNRTDDSVVKIIGNKERVFRRSRGYAPSPVNTTLNVEGIFAAGAELVNCFCIGKGKQAILSQHIGDLKNVETSEFYTESIEKFKRLFRFKPSFIAYDMHPDYLSTNYASKLKIKGIPVQHHHAHIASCMAEHGLNEKVIGISFDGTGYGADGNIWGSEFLLADLEGFERYSHFEYIPLPGGDKAVEEPWRIAVSYLYLTFGTHISYLDIPFLNRVGEPKLSLILEAIDKKINTPLSSGAGRLFDAVAALINVCPISKFHAEAPMRLEALTIPSLNSRYEISVQETISFKEMFQQILEDLNHKNPVNVISTKFHNTIIYSIFKTALKIRRETGLKKVVLSGGTFQNKYISERIESLLIKNNFDVFSQHKIPCNDGGIALGQLIIAAKKRG